MDSAGLLPPSLMAVLARPYGINDLGYKFIGDSAMTGKSADCFARITLAHHGKLKQKVGSSLPTFEFI
jgi:hypothetical protein